MHDNLFLSSGDEVHHQPPLKKGTDDFCFIGDDIRTSRQCRIRDLCRSLSMNARFRVR